MPRKDLLSLPPPSVRERDRSAELSYALKRQALWSVSGLLALLIVLGIVVTIRRPESAEKMWILLIPIISMAIGGMLGYVGSARFTR